MDDTKVMHHEQTELEQNTNTLAIRGSSVREMRHRHRCPPSWTTLVAVALICLCSAFTWPGRVPHFVYEANHGDAAQRITALRWLAQFPSEATTRALLSALEDADASVRSQAAHALARAGIVEAVPALLPWLNSANAAERVLALQALAALANAQTRPNIERALTDPALEVRTAAVNALARIAARDGSLPAVVLDAIAAPEAALRLATITALDQPAAARDPAVRSDANLNLIIKLSARVLDTDPAVRAASLRALEHLHDARAWPALLRGASDRDETVRMTALAALGDSAAPAATAILRAQLSATPRIARTAIAALGRSADPAVLPVLSTQLLQTQLTGAAAIALVERARRSDDAATWTKTRDALTNALAHVVDGTQVDHLTSALLAVAPFAPVAPAAPAWLEALRQSRGDVVLVTRAALLASDATQLLPVLLQRLQAGTPDSAGPLLDALELALPAAPQAARMPVGAALHARLQTANSAVQRARLLTLLAAAHSELAWTLPPTASTLERCAIADWFGVLPATPERRQQLLALLDDDDTSVRDRAALALARSADALTIQLLVDRLAQPVQRYELHTLSALSGALVQLDKGKTLPVELRNRLFEQLSVQRLHSNDARVAASALVALRSFDDARNAPLVAHLLRTGSAKRRAGAVLALGDFAVGETRRLLRYTLQNDAPQAALHATLALAQLGTENDAEALARAAARGTWPLPAAASYALARISERATAKRHTLAQVLCRLGVLRDPYVRANIAAGLAALGAAACGGDVTPEAWLEATLASVQRTAAARWLRALPPQDAAAERARGRLLAACAADPDAQVARACAAPLSDNNTARVRGLIRAYAADGSTPLAERIVALRLPDASVFVAPTDANAQVLLPPYPPGAVTLEDPADVPSTAQWADVN
ncbi:MAG: hypothetical protein RL701_526 [Pseudomonadota bacterium]